MNNETKRFYPNFEAAHCYDRILVALDRCPTDLRPRFVARLKRWIGPVLASAKVRSAKARAKRKQS